MEEYFKNILLDEETRYFEFDNIKDYNYSLKKIREIGAEILYNGINRIEAGKWIIVIREKNK